MEVDQNLDRLENFLKSLNLEEVVACSENLSDQKMFPNSPISPNSIAIFILKSQGEPENASLQGNFANFVATIDENHVPFKWDVQFQDFISFSLNQIKWAKVYHTFQRRQLGLDLKVIWDLQSPIHTLIDHKRLMWKAGAVSDLKPIHKEFLQSRLEYLGDIRVEALRGAKQRQQASSSEIKNREPFGFQNFQHVMGRAHYYDHLVLEECLSWMGCRYRCPIIQFPKSS